MTSNTPLPFYFSYSRAEADSTCPRKRYLGSEWGGTGLSPIEEGWDLTYGDIIHRYLEQLAKTGTIDYAAARADALSLGRLVLDADAAKHYAAMAEGHLRGFVKAVWPRWMQEYDILETEKLHSWELEPGFVFRFRQDILLRSKFDAHVCYPDYKTTSSDSAQWIASWAKHPQLHSSAFALQQLGHKVDQILVQGLYKGYKDKKTGLHNSIFAKGWVNREYSMHPQYAYTYQRGRGWEAFSTFEEFEDLGEWIANMPAEVLTAQFPQTAPIMPREDIAAAYFRQQMHREREVADALTVLRTCETQAGIDAVLDRHFRQCFNKCDPPYGFKCEMRDICWVPSVGADPLGSKLFVRREKVFEAGAEAA